MWPAINGIEIAEAIMEKDLYNFKRFKLEDVIRLYTKLKLIKPRTLDQQLLFTAIENYLWDEYRL